MLSPEDNLEDSRNLSSRIPVLFTNATSKQETTPLLPFNVV
jgi:hypothetical protein